MRCLFAFVIAAALMCATPGQALASDGNLYGNQNADFGPAAQNGSQAFDGIDGRALTLHTSMGCGNEHAFMEGFTGASLFGESDDDPTTTTYNEGLRAWPETLLIGKAALLTAEAFQEPPPVSDFRPRCINDLGPIEGTRDMWVPLTKDGKQHPGENGADVVNRVYQEWFNTAIDGSRSSACDHVAYVTGESLDRVEVRLTPACVARQIRVVITDPNNGPWRKEYNTDKGRYEVVPKIAGTDPSDLPCASELDFNGFEGVGGDWDMGVTGYTRLTYLLYRVHTEDPGMDRDLSAALDRLNDRFLTLRSSPGDATARESFNLAFSCGPIENRFGSAMDTMEDSGSDPGIGRYSENGKDAVGRSSLWDDLGHFLVIALVLLVAVALAVGAGGLLSTGVLGVFGPAGVFLAAAVAVISILTPFLASVPETENHVLMQNSARYLKNKLMMAELSTQGRRKKFDKLADLNEEVRTRLLDDMQRIAEHDFREYNAKPYARYSHSAMLNLIDFACDISWDYPVSEQRMQGGDVPCDPRDRAVVDAAAAVLDLSAAKAAVGSLDGRRMIPFRRKSQYNKVFYDSSRPAAARSITELVEGADTMVGALQIWTGQMRFAAGGNAAPTTFEQLVFYSSSRYRPDPIILQIAVDKTTPLWQQYRHDTREAYSSGPGWLITAGGTDEMTADGLDLPGLTIHTSDYDQRGVGVPTTLMIDAAPDLKDPLRFSRVPDFLRFDGKTETWDDRHWSYSNNNCVAGNFACGLNPRTPTGFDKASCGKEISDRFFAIDSTVCPAIGLPAVPNQGVYIALYDHDQQWGFFEVAAQRDFATIDDFIAAVKAKNHDYLDSWAGKNAGDDVTYVTLAGNPLLFTPEDEDFGADRRACGIVNHENGSRFSISSVPAPDGRCEAVGRHVLIDLNDKDHPVREAQGGAPLPPLY